MDSSPFPSQAVLGVSDEPHDTVPHVPSGTELDLSWEVMTRQRLQGSRLLSDLGRKDAVAEPGCASPARGVAGTELWRWGQTLGQHPAAGLQEMTWVFVTHFLKHEKHHLTSSQAPSPALFLHLGLFFHCLP